MYVWIEKKGRRTGHGKEHLSRVEGFGSGVTVIEEAHIDKVDEQAGRVFWGECIVSRPLVEDQQGEVTKQAGHEDNLGNEAQEDVQRLLEVPAVWNILLLKACAARETLCEKHLLDFLFSSTL